jgi:hypothetical protein
MKAANKKKLDKMVGEMEAIQASMQEIFDEESDAWDSKSEKWQESEAGERAQSQICELEESLQSIDAALSALGNVVSE